MSAKRWKGAVKQSAFVILTSGDEYYAVRNERGEIGAPGGKRDPGDASIWDTAAREFREETGGTLPRGGRYFYFEWGNSYTTSRVYHREVTAKERAILPVGEHAGDTEVESLWVGWKDASLRPIMRSHIARALSLLEIIMATPAMLAATAATSPAAASSSAAACALPVAALPDAASAARALPDAAPADSPGNH